MNANYNLLAPAEEVTEKIQSITSQILEDFPDRTPIFAALLHGGNAFASKLAFELTKQNSEYHPEFRYMTTSAYKKGNQAGEPRIVADIDPDNAGTDDDIVRGRDVVIVDDVLDTAKTANHVIEHLMKRGAATVRVAVLCTKDVERAYDINADYVGFEFGDGWLVGMGMDDGTVATEAYRWREDIWEKQAA